MICKFFDKKTSVGGTKTEDISNKELAEELHKHVITKFNKTKVHSYFMWGVNLVDIWLINKFNKGFRFLLYIIDIYSKYT